MEVAQHVGDNTVRCVMLSGSEGLSRGMQVEAPGKTIEVPVGENTLGRMFNVLEMCIRDRTESASSASKMSTRR